MKHKNLALFNLFTALLLSPSLAQAQDHNTGGGSFTESDMQDVINQIDSFLDTKAGRTAFPEIELYNQTHDQSFHELAMSIRPRVQRESVVDDAGNDRDCVSHIVEKPPFFVCNTNRIPERSMKNKPSLTRVVFHEMLVIARIEAPLNRSVVSEYPVSSRITKFMVLSNTKDYKLGKKTAAPSSTLRSDQIKEIATNAQGSVLKNADTNEFIATVKGTGGQQQQQQQGGEFATNLSIEELNESENFSFAIVSANSRGVKTIGEMVEDTEELSFFISKLESTRISKTARLLIMKAFTLNELQYNEAVQMAHQAVTGMPGKINKLKDAQFRVVKMLLMIATADISDDADSMREALGLAKEEETFELELGIK